MRKKLLTSTAILMMIVILLTPTGQGRSQTQAPTVSQIRNFLAWHPLITVPGAEVLDVTLQGEALIIDLSQEVLPDRKYDEAIFTQLQKDLNLAFQIDFFFMTTFKVEGKLLEDWGRAEPSALSAAKDFSASTPTTGAPLSGIKIAIAPGHGLFWSETWSQWAYQRGEYYGIREDLVNSEIIRYLNAALLNQGATVITLREMDPNARIGVTGYPAWHEAARQYLIYEGAPSWVWNSSNTNYNRDIRARPYGANYYEADLLINLHNNGYNGTLSGTETYYDTNNHPDSPTLAAIVHNSIINLIRSEYDPDWIDRNVRASDSGYGEINYAHMPAILIELAFMDKQVPDNAYLQDEVFKQLAAKAITLGICEFYDVTCDDIPITLPTIQESPTLNPAFGSGVCDSGWYRFPNQRGQYAYLALNAQNANQSTHQAFWQPVIALNGLYQVEAFIPDHGPITWDCPGISVISDTAQATYRITHANGVTDVTADQGLMANGWLDLGAHYFEYGSNARVQLTDLTGEAAQSTMVSFSALRFTLIGDGATPFYNTAWLNSNYLTQGADTPVENIRNFLKLVGSCLADPIEDADGVVMDIPAVIFQASINRGINPRILLAIMENEQSALTQCPDPTALANLMGLSPANTARQQIDNTALLLRNALDALNANGQTPNGWSTGSVKITQDNVAVTPANNAITVLFDIHPFAGLTWGGELPEENGLSGFYDVWQTYAFNLPLPSQEPLRFYFPLLLQEN